METFKWLKAASLIIKAQCTGIVNLPMKVHLTIWMLSPLCCRSNTITLNLDQGPTDIYSCTCFLLLWDQPARHLITAHFKIFYLKHLCYTMCHFSRQNDGPWCWRIVAGYVIYMFLIKENTHPVTVFSPCCHPTKVSAAVPSDYREASFHFCTIICEAWSPETLLTLYNHPWQHHKMSIYPHGNSKCSDQEHPQKLDSLINDH